MTDFQDSSGRLKIDTRGQSRTKSIPVTGNMVATMKTKNKIKLQKTAKQPRNFYLLFFRTITHISAKQSMLSTNEPSSFTPLKVF